MAPRVSNVTVPLLPERVLAFRTATLTPKAVAMAPGLGGPGDPPAGKRVANPVIRICLSVARGLELLLDEVVQTTQPGPLGLLKSRYSRLFRRTASKRVNFSMSDKRDAASFNWYARNERMSEGIAIAVKISSTVKETANSTILKPPMRLRRVREMGALLCKVISSFKGGTLGPAYKDGQEAYMKQLPYQGQPGATATKHSTFYQ
jgi:hypothetical protein